MKTNLNGCPDCGKEKRETERGAYYCHECFLKWKKFSRQKIGLGFAIKRLESLSSQK